MVPLGAGMLTVMPHSVSGDVVATKQLVFIVISSLPIGKIGIVTFSAAELQVINSVTGAAPFLFNTLEEAVQKLIPGGVKPTKETRIINGDGSVAAQVSESASGDQAPEGQGQPSAETLQQVEDLKHQLDDANASNKTLSDLVKQREARVSELEKQITELTAKVNNPQPDEASAKEIKDLKDTIAKRDEAINAEQDNNAELTSRVKELEQLLSEKSQKVDELSKQTSEGIPKAEYDKVVEEKAQMESNYNNIRSILAKTVETNKMTWNKEEGVYKIMEDPNVG